VVESVRGVIGVRLVEGERRGPAAARNRALGVVRGEVVLFLNDDVEAAADLLERHVEAHAGRVARGLGPAMVLGAAPWAVVDTPERPDRALDRMVRQTSAVFFYDQMTEEKAGARARDPEHDWGFRHAWTLNLSVGARWAAVGFEERLPSPVFEDLEWAWRVRRACAAGGGMPVVYRSAAVVTHHHRYSAAGFLERERAIGRNTVALVRVNGACAREVFGRDVSGGEEMARRAEVVARGKGEAARWRAEFMAMAEGDGEGAALYEASRGLREFERAEGYLEACGR
jgi:GT2 family glycosyltransferase